MPVDLGYLVHRDPAPFAESSQSTKLLYFRPQVLQCISFPPTVQYHVRQEELGPQICVYPSSMIHKALGGAGGPKDIFIFCATLS